MFNHISFSSDVKIVIFERLGQKTQVLFVFMSSLHLTQNPRVHSVLKCLKNVEAHNVCLYSFYVIQNYDKHLAEDFVPTKSLELSGKDYGVCCLVAKKDPKGSSIVLCYSFLGLYFRFQKN